MHKAREKRFSSIVNRRRQSTMVRRERRRWRSLLGENVSFLSLGWRKSPEQLYVENTEADVVGEKISFAEHLSTRANFRSYQKPLPAMEEDLLIIMFERCMTLKSDDDFVESIVDNTNLDVNKVYPNACVVAAVPEAETCHPVTTLSFTSDDGYDTMRSHDDVDSDGQLSSSPSFEMTSLSGSFTDQSASMGVNLSDDRVHEEMKNQHQNVGESVTILFNDNGLDLGSVRSQNQFQSVTVTTYQQHDNDAGSSTEISQDITDMIKTLRQEATVNQKMKRGRHRSRKRHHENVHDEGYENYGYKEVENKRGRYFHNHTRCESNRRHRFKTSRR